MPSLKGLRWLDIVAVAVVLGVAGALWQSAPAFFGDAAQEGDVLREALAVATDECYASYRGVELQACLAGAMQAHLQALGDRDGAAPDTEPRSAGNNL